MTSRRSVVYTRQGNPAWAGQERDNVLGVRPNDMFFSTWLNTSKIAIPQADEQQRLLANLITVMVRDRLPMPRFWYLPRGEKAVVVMSGDDHSPINVPVGGTAFAFDRYKELSPPGCVVANWDCVRSTSYIFPESTLTEAEATAYVADGFEVALHTSYGGCTPAPHTPAEFEGILTAQLGQFGSRYTGVPAPVSNRNHCVEWLDWASTAKLELQQGIRMDANYYHFPGSWIGAAPGFMNGGGFPMRFADTDGTPINVYQQNTNMNDEVGQAYPATINALLDNALGANGYYGAFGANIHNDNPQFNPLAEAIIASAQARSVPVVSYSQLLEWVDGRNASSIGSLVLERRHLDVHHVRRFRGERPAGSASHPGALRVAPEPHVRRLPERATRCRRSRASSTRCSPRSAAPARRATRNPAPPARPAATRGTCRARRRATARRSRTPEDARSG